jgi:tRNA(fMet)-specific endonuclease VapC
MRYLLDSNACIAIVRGNSIVVEKLASIAPDDLAVSTITWFELYTGVEKCDHPHREREKLEKLRASVHEIPFQLSAGLEAAKIRADLESRGEMIGPYDVLLAGQARSMGLILITANTKEFVRVPGLDIENWQIQA